MRKPLFYFTCGFFTAIALLAAAVFLFYFGPKGNEYEVYATSPSPDGKHIATVYTGMGGGAAGWCSSYVLVSTEDEKEKIRQGKAEYKKIVFDGSCGTRPTVEWETSEKLVIKYKGAKDPDGIRLYKTPVSDDEQVKIVFVEL